MCVCVCVCVCMRACVPFHFPISVFCTRPVYSPSPKHETIDISHPVSVMVLNQHRPLIAFRHPILCTICPCAPQAVAWIVAMQSPLFFAGGPLGKGWHFFVLLLQVKAVFGAFLNIPTEGYNQVGGSSVVSAPVFCFSNFFGGCRFSVSAMRCLP